MPRIRNLRHRVYSRVRRQKRLKAFLAAAAAALGTTESAAFAAYYDEGYPLGQGGSVLVTVSPGAIFEAIGNSTVAGEATGGGTAQFTTSWPVQLASLLSARGLRASAQNRFGCGGGTWASLLAKDGRVTSTGAWSQNGSLYAGGNGFGGTADGDTASFALGVCTKMVIHWVNNTAGRIFSYSVDGGAAVDVTTTGVYEPRTTVVTAPVGAHTLTITRKTTGAQIRGVEAYDDTNGVPVRIYNFGISGATSANMIDNTDTVVGRRVQYGQFNPDVAIIEGGIINDWRTSVPVATSKANLTTLVQTLKAAKGGTCKVILLTPVFDSGTAGTTAQQDLYVAAMKEVTDEQDVFLVDVRPTFRSWDYANSQGWMSDTVHPTNVGYGVIAGLVSAAIGVAF